MSKPKILSQKIAYKGKKIEVREDRIVHENGKEHTVELVLHPGAVCIVARPSANDVLLIRQYRHATGKGLLEIPAGTLNAGEDPRDCAFRELEEETGYRAGKMIERARFFTTPGFTTEFMYLYEAAELVKTQTNFDEDEVIELDVISNLEVLRMIDEGRIEDAKSILGLLRVLK
jgi:ADP-ribose pyrophosphatase